MAQLHIDIINGHNILMEAPW